MESGAIQNEHKIYFLVENNDSLSHKSTNNQ